MLTMPELLARLNQEKSQAIKAGAPLPYIHGLEAAIAIIRIAAREERYK